MTSGKSSREQRAAKVKAQQAALRKAEARRRNSIIAGAVVAVLVVVVGVAALVQSGRSGGSAANATTPGNVTGTAGTSIVVGKDSAKVTVSLFEDFQCPACRQFEENSGDLVRSLLDAGTIKIEYRPVAYLDRFSSTSYSTRSLNAAACVRDSSPASFEAFHDALFANQPEENTAGLPDSKLVELAKGAGATDVDACIKDQRFKDWTVKASDAASKDGINQTPTVLVNGQNLGHPSPDELKAAVEKAAQG
jgi:protein-disulfide isomerase